MLGELQPLFSKWPSLDRFRRDMDELFDRFFGEVGHRRPNSSMTGWPAVESFFRDGNWVTRVDLPGVDAKDIDVSVAGNTLTIRASRERHTDEGNQDFETREISYSRFERSLTLPKGVDTDRIKASYHRGVLEVSMPASPDLVGRKIPIEIETEDKEQIEHQAG